MSAYDLSGDNVFLQKTQQLVDLMLPAMGPDDNSTGMHPGTHLILRLCSVFRVGLRGLSSCYAAVSFELLNWERACVGGLLIHQIIRCIVMNTSYLRSICPFTPCKVSDK